MGIFVEYGGKRYHYTEVDGNMLWVDEWQSVIPVKFHSILREKALASGVDPSVFIGTVKMPEPIKEKKEVVKKPTQKKKVSNGFNPFLNK